MIILNFEKEYMIHGINELNVQSNCHWNNDLKKERRRLFWRSELISNKIWIKGVKLHSTYLDFAVCPLSQL